jgi:hypothetical protein
MLEAGKAGDQAGPATILATSSVERWAYFSPAPVMQRMGVGVSRATHNRKSPGFFRQHVCPAGPNQKWNTKLKIMQVLVDNIILTSMCQLYD